MATSTIWSGGLKLLDTKIQLIIIHRLIIFKCHSMRKIASFSRIFITYNVVQVYDEKVLMTSAYLVYPLKGQPTWNSWNRTWNSWNQDISTKLLIRTQDQRKTQDDWQ